MKKILFLLSVFAAFSIGASNSSKDSIQPNKWVFKVGVNIVDSTGEAKVTNFFEDYDEFAFGGTPLKVNIERRFNELFAFEIAGSLNEWKAGKGVIDNDFSVPLTEDQDYFAVDANLKFYIDEGFNWFTGSDWFEMYLSGGVGYFKVTEGGTTANFGTGFNLWISESIGLNIETVAKWILDSEPAIYDSAHIQYSAGLTFRPNGQDRDNDGIYDYNDSCPNIAGTKEGNGCPDDEAKELTTAALPVDSDNDGVTDSLDNCPNVAGLASNNGCPLILDSDKDGIIDSADNCPTIAGPVGNNGCPFVDSDNDGVIDSADNCPTIAGSPSNNGCPEKKSADNIEIERLSRQIRFHTDKDSFTPETYAILQNVVSFVNRYPNSKFRIEGHTDSIGEFEYNKRLSEKRANAVKAYLISNGVPEYNLEATGLGEEQPIQSNMNKGGRKMNRRVQITQID